VKKLEEISRKINHQKFPRNFLVIARTSVKFPTKSSVICSTTKNLKQTFWQKKNIYLKKFNFLQDNI
jgi:hypothetical protein